MTERHIISDLGELKKKATDITPFGEYHVPELGLSVTEHPDVLSPRLSFSGTWTVKR